MVSRAHASYTVFDLKRLKGGFMMRGENTSEEREVIRTQISYLAMLASSNRAIGHMLYIEHFCEAHNKHRPILDNSMLNKIAFEWVNRNKRDLSLQQKDLINTFGATAAADLISRERGRIEDSVSNHMEEAKDFQIRHEDYLRNADSIYRKYEQALLKRCEALEKLDNMDEGGDEPAIIEELRKVTSLGSWVLYNISGSVAYFYSAADITCSYVNPAANVDMSVNMGRYTAMVNLTNNKLHSITDLYDNICINSRHYAYVIHPHATSSSICWGSARGTVQQLALECNLVRQFTLLDELLACYSPSNPYATLRSFSRNRNNRINNDLDYEEFPQWMLQDILGDNYEQERWDDSQEGETEEENDTCEEDSFQPEIRGRSPIERMQQQEVEERTRREAAAQAAMSASNITWELPTSIEQLRGQHTQGYIIDELPEFTPRPVEPEDTSDIPF